MSGSSERSTYFFPYLQGLINLRKKFENDIEFTLNNGNPDDCKALYNELLKIKVVRRFPNFNLFGICTALIKRAYDVHKQWERTGKKGPFSGYKFVAKGLLSFGGNNPALFLSALYDARRAADALDLKQLKDLSEIHKLGKGLLGGVYKKEWKSFGLDLKRDIEAAKTQTNVYL